jgi:hypothetical protein
MKSQIQSGRPGSNWLPPTWKDDALPNELLPLKSVVEDIIPVVTTHFTHFADWTGLEPATSAVTGQHSNQLNYQSSCSPSWT